MMPLTQSTAHISTAPTCPAPQEACDLFQTVFNHHISLSHWHWKYQQAPALQRCHILAHSPGGKLIGHAGAIVLPGTWQQQTIGMAQVTDVMVHPDHRSDLGPDNLYRRIMKALQQALHDPTAPHATFIYGFPGQRPSTLGARMGLYRQLPKIEQLQITAHPMSSAWARWRDAWAWHLTPQDRPDPAWLEHCCRVAAKHSTAPHLLKNAAYLNWRYLNHPDQPYKLWALRHRWQNAGWLITRLKPAPTIVDAFLAPGLAGCQLPQLITALARATDSPEWAGWQPAHKNSPHLSPICPVEMASTTGFHPGHLQPQFQPGDTDVF